MASQLIGLFRKLDWKIDFTGRPPSLCPQYPDGGVAPTFIKVPLIHVPANFDFVPTPDGEYRLADNVTVTIGPPKGGFNNEWSPRSQAEIDDALNHEQGHYNLAALLARDFFVDVMLLKQETFADSFAGRRAVAAIKADSVDKELPVHDLYDLERSRRGKDGQRFWDHLIWHAFNNERASGTTSADGKVHKARLLVILREQRGNLTHRSTARRRTRARCRTDGVAQDRDPRRAAILRACSPP